MDTDKSIRASVENGGKLKVTYFHRLRLPDVHFSIESIFARTRIELADSVQAKVVTSPFRSRGLFRRIWNVIVARQQQSEINHVTGDVNFLTIGMNRRKTILTHHDSYFIDRTSGLRRELLRLVWLKLPVACSRFVTTVSEATKQELVQLIDCDPDRIVVIHNAISDQFQPFHKPFDFARPRILQMGTAVNKNIESLAVALRGLACKLIIVGRLSQQQRNVLEKSQIDFEMKVELSEDQVVEQYREADIVTLVSTIEGFGMPIVEAQVTVDDRGGAPQIGSRREPGVQRRAGGLVDRGDEVRHWRVGGQEVRSVAAERAEDPGHFSARSLRDPPGCVVMPPANRLAQPGGQETVAPMIALGALGDALHLGAIPEHQDTRLGIGVMHLRDKPSERLVLRGQPIHLAFLVRAALSAVRVGK